ncbi:hypothetical protein [Enterococcus sp. AZ072]|uniref:hypothetical protein n=1 Tax=unclassified Enterococcus TaxID=2608891 RepID=UPI003D2937D6
MSQMIKRVGLMFVVVLSIVALPSFMAKTVYITLLFVVVITAYFVQPKLQPIKVRRNERRN